MLPTNPDLPVLFEAEDHDVLSADMERKCCACSTSNARPSQGLRWLLGDLLFPGRRKKLLASSKQQHLCQQHCNANDCFPVEMAQCLLSSYSKTLAVHSTTTCQMQNKHDARQLRHSLQHNPYMEDLSITGRRVDRRFLRCFSRASLDSLTHLTLTGNQLYRDPRSVRLLMTSLPTQSLRHLNLSWNGLDHEAIALLGRRSLDDMNHLQSIRLCGNPMGPKGLNVLVQEGNLQRIPYIDLWDCDLGDEGAAILARSLMRPDARVQRLVLDMNGIGNPGVHALALGMGHCPSLVALDLYCNNVDSVGVRALALALLCSNLEELNLRANRVGPAGAKILAQVLNDTNLKTLHLCHNGIGDEGVQSLALALAGEPVISPQSQRQDEEDEEAPGGDATGPLASLRAAASTNTIRSTPPSTLRELSLSSNFLTIKSVKSLTAALNTNTTLKRLFLTGNMIDRRAAMHFCHVLQTTNQSLLQLTVLDATYENHLVYDKLNMHLASNASGRRHWGDPSIPLTAWTHKLAGMTPDLCFRFLRNARPEIVDQEHRHHHA